MDMPLVSCMMPTYGRPDYVAESLAMFLAQDYPAKELIILNDCPGQVFQGDFPNVSIVNVDSRWATLGEKRNAAIEMARGDYIAVWDDDDVYLPWRLSYCMRRIQQLQAPLYCPADYWAYWGDDALHENEAILNWIYHPLVIFRKDLWREVGGYPSQTLCEDTVFFKKVLLHLGIEWPRDPIHRADRVMILRGRSKYVHTSINGGKSLPDTKARTIELTPEPIEDPLLRSIMERLIFKRNDQLVRRTAGKPQNCPFPGVPRNGTLTWLDTLEPHHIQVGYGDLGRHGNLGYENKPVEINGELRSHSLSAHASSKLTYHLRGHYSHFYCQVAINDDVGSDSTSADFQILVDGRLAAIARNVRSCQIPRQISIDVRGVDRLDLIALRHRWDFCHTVWVDPCLVSIDPAEQAVTLTDALRRAEITLPQNLARAELCLATVGSPGFENWIDDLFGSICANAQCPHAMLAIFAFGESDHLRQVAEKYRAVLIPCRPLAPIDCTAKSVLYSIARVIPARKFICLDADMLVLDDLRPVVHAIDSAPEGSIFVCREAMWVADLAEGLEKIYAGKRSDINELLGQVNPVEARYPLVVNDGIFAGTAEAITGIDDAIRCFHAPIEWMTDPRANIPWRNQFLFNLALAQTSSGIELDPRFNVQLNSQQLEFSEIGTSVIASTLTSRKASVVHFNGVSRHYFPEWRGRFRMNRAPVLHGADMASNYEFFLKVFRQWLGKHGRDGLAWSFYGNLDGQGGRECAASDFPLLATLHYLIRSNGCRRVVETGTARGVSAACLASAVAHYSDGVVVTIDVATDPERESLWNMLPEALSDSIEARIGDSIELLRLAHSNGETYEAALLDSIHTAEHVLSEFEIARHLVCPGGLILIHDAVLPHGTVPLALDRIASMGYGVTRLWTAEGGDQADAGLGLAVIENRCKKGQATCPL